MELEIQKLLREHGLDKVKEMLVLEVKERDNLVLLKYNTLGADWTQSALYDCRGIILDRDDNWNVVAYPYRKFFNIGEGYCAKLDWDNTIVFDKADGCCDENTILITEEGPKTIKEICDFKYKGKVFARDLDLDIDIFTDIINYEIKSNNNDWYEIELENGQTVKLTGSHRIWIPSLNCYRKVNELLKDDEILYMKK